MPASLTICSLSYRLLERNSEETSGLHGATALRPSCPSEATQPRTTWAPYQGDLPARPRTRNRPLAGASGRLRSDLVWVGSDDSNVLSLVTLAALADVELDLLAIFE
jgi:hypothetical protein